MSRKQTKSENAEPASNEAGAPMDAETSRLSEAEERLREAEERVLLAHADLQNVKRRHREDMDRFRKTATEELVVALLPVIDDLERAIAAGAETRNVDAVLEGVELTLSKMMNVLKAEGVERIPGVGAAFDPNYHDAITQTPPSEEHPNGTISEEIRPGYTQHGHVIRPSMVAVAHE